MGCHFRISRRKRIIEFCGWICYYCQRDLGKLPITSRGPWGLSGAITIDHKIPLSRGGTNEDINLVIACWHCNVVKKGDMTADEYFKAIGDKK